MTIDGKEVGRGKCAPVLGDPVTGLNWVANRLRERGLGLKADDAIAIGTWTGLHFIKHPCHVMVDYGALGGRHPLQRLRRERLHDFSNRSLFANLASLRWLFRNPLPLAGPVDLAVLHAALAGAGRDLKNHPAVFTLGVRPATPIGLQHHLETGQ